MHNAYIFLFIAGISLPMLPASASAQTGGLPAPDAGTQIPASLLPAISLPAAPASPAPSKIAFDLAEMPQAQTQPPAPPAMQGPVDEQAQHPPPTEGRYASLGSRTGAAKWETLGLLAYITATQAYWTDGTTHFHFKDEGWFGKDTNNLGIDKLTHAFNAYLFAEFLGARIARKTGDRARAALPAALVSTGLMFYGEMWDAHKKDSGFSVQDLIFNMGGAALSVLRHTVPGLEEKLDFRLLVMPNSEVYTFKGKRHYQQQRFLLSLELAGFESLHNSPLRFVELQAGYRGRNFTNAARAAGLTPRRDIFFGIGLNIKELFFKNSQSRLGRAIGSSLDYFQLPYTAVHIH